MVQQSAAKNKKIGVAHTTEDFMQNQKAQKRTRNRAFRKSINTNSIPESIKSVKPVSSKILRLFHLIRDKQLTDSLILLNQLGIPDEAALLIISLLERVVKAGRSNIWHP